MPERDRVVIQEPATPGEKEIVRRIVTAVSESFRQEKLDGSIDCIVFIIDDFGGYEEFCVRLWVNRKHTVAAKVAAGVELNEARWLYEHWRADSPEIVAINAYEVAEDKQLLLAWVEETGEEYLRERFYGLAGYAAIQVRAAFPELLTGIPILVDNNHEYDGCVVTAIEAVNLNGEADDWLRNPPPECVPLE